LYRLEILFLIVREEHRLRASEERMLRKEPGPQILFGIP
jgi:hypothetical protein